MAKWIKISEMAEKCTALFFHCFLFERGVHCFTYQKNKKTNKQTKSIAFRICLQLVSIIYIERERERERERDIYMVQLWGNRPFWKVDLSEFGHEYDNFH